MKPGRPPQPKLRKGLKLTPELRDFLRRRTMPFLNASGIQMPLPHLLQEVYMQGLDDALQVLTIADSPKLAVTEDTQA